MRPAADAVVVGGGTVGGWCAHFLRAAGLDVVLLERGVLGAGASSRAAGIVRGQGGTPAAVRLGTWSRAFYRRQHAELGIDSGFVEQGYFMPAFTLEQVEQARGPLPRGRRSARYPGRLRCETSPSACW